MSGFLSAAYDLSSASLLSGVSVSSKSLAHASSTSLGDILEAASDHSSAILDLTCASDVWAGAFAMPACFRRALSRSAVVLRGCCAMEGDERVVQRFSNNFFRLLVGGKRGTLPPWSKGVPMKREIRDTARPTQHARIRNRFGLAARDTHPSYF